MGDLQEFGLRLNAKKIKILCTECQLDDSVDFNFFELSNEFVEVHTSSKAHRFLRRYLNLSEVSRLSLEHGLRRYQGWNAFNKHRKCILNHHVSLRKRVRIFDISVPPTVLFFFATASSLQSHLRGLDVLQRKMMRRIIGWRRIFHESAHATMQRMNERLRRANHLYYCEPWSMKFARGQWRYVHHLATAPTQLWGKCLCKYTWNSFDDFAGDTVPYHLPGHPRMKWDHSIHGF